MLEGQTTHDKHLWLGGAVVPSLSDYMPIAQSLVPNLCSWMHLEKSQNEDVKAQTPFPCLKQLKGPS